MSNTKNQTRLPATPALCSTVCDAEQLLGRMPLNEIERQFAIDLGEQVVDLVIDAHWMVKQGGDKCDDACVAAAVAYALALLNEPRC